jgi:hypothetical protein
MIKKLAIAAAALLMLTGCSKSEFAMTSTPAVAEITAVNADTDSAASGVMTVGEGQCVVISANNDKGEMNVMFKDHTGNIELSEAIRDQSLNSYPLPAGEYDVTATVTEKATGSITVLIMDEGAFDPQNFDFESAVEAAGGSLN